MPRQLLIILSSTAGIMLVLGSGHARGQPSNTNLCRQDIVSRASGEGGYSAQGSHCEGTYSEDVAGGLDILSVTTGPVRGSANGMLNIAAPYASGAVEIVGSSLLASAPFRFNTRLASPAGYGWDLQRLRRTTTLQASDLGFLGYPVNAERGTLTPVCAAANCVRGGQIVVVVRPALSLVALDAKVFRRRNGKWDAGTLIHMAPSGAPRNMAISLRLSVGDGPEMISIQLEGKRAGLPALRTSALVSLS